MTNEEILKKSWNQFQAEVNLTAVRSGFWDISPTHRPNPAEKIALMHSELSEALEALRKNIKEDDHVPEFNGVEAELADVVIRIMDFAEHYGYDVVGAMVAKAAYNEGRPYMHGKAF